MTADADAPRVEALVAVLERELAPGEKMHDWRCEHPDRWPEPCNCAQIMADLIREALVGDVAWRLCEWSDPDTCPRREDHRAEARRLLGVE